MSRSAGGSSASLSCRRLVVDGCVWSGGGYCASVYRRCLRYSGRRAEVGGGCWSLGKARNHDVRATHHPRDWSNRGWRRFSSCRRLDRARGWFVWFFRCWMVCHRRPSSTAVPRAVADCGERCPRFAILALRAASLSVVLSATQAAHEGC